MKVQFTQEQTMGDLLPEGIYDFIITNVEDKTSQTTGEEYINVSFKVLDGQHANRVAFSNFNPNSTNPIGINVFVGFLKAAGLDPLDADTDDLVGKMVTGTIKHSDGYANVRALKAYKGSPQASMAATRSAPPPPPPARSAPPPPPKPPVPAAFIE